MKGTVLIVAAAFAGILAGGASVYMAQTNDWNHFALDADYQPGVYLSYEGVEWCQISPYDRGAAHISLYLSENGEANMRLNTPDPKHEMKLMVSFDGGDEMEVAVEYFGRVKEATMVPNLIRKIAKADEIVIRQDTSVKTHTIVVGQSFDRAYAACLEWVFEQE